MTEKYPTELFLLLLKEKIDGHRFVQRAVNNGAACCVVDKEGKEAFGNLPVVAVDDTFKALRDIAAFYREQFKYSGSRNHRKRWKDFNKRYDSLCIGQRICYAEDGG